MGGEIPVQIDIPGGVLAGFEKRIGVEGRNQPYRHGRGRGKVRYPIEQYLDARRFVAVNAAEDQHRRPVASEAAAGGTSAEMRGADRLESERVDGREEFASRRGQGHWTPFHAPANVGAMGTKLGHVKA